MNHDPAFGAATDASLHPRRALELEVYARYIDTALASAPEILPFGAAQNLLRRFETADAARIHKEGSITRLQMLGVSAQSDDTPYALLRNWQSAAWNRIHGGQA